MNFVFLALLALSAPSMAAEFPCANMAKYGAIKAYKSETGTIQGSDGIQTVAVPTSARGNLISYLVTISDNNEDGETWEVDYTVVLREISTGKCQVLSTKKVAER